MWLIKEPNPSAGWMPRIRILKSLVGTGSERFQNQTCKYNGGWVSFWGKECCERWEGSRVWPQAMPLGNTGMKRRAVEGPGKQTAECHCNSGWRTVGAGEWASGRTSIKWWVRFERAGSVRQGGQKSLQRRFTRKQVKKPVNPSKILEVKRQGETGDRRGNVKLSSSPRWERRVQI